MTNDIFESVSLQKGHTRAAMISALTSSAVDCGFEPLSGQTKGYKIAICCFSAMQGNINEKEQKLGDSESG